MTTTATTSGLDTLTVHHGDANRLGATWRRDGTVNFAVFSHHGEAVDLVLFRPGSPEREAARVRLADRTGSVWHVAVGGLEPGWLYGFRVHGPWMPEWGQLFNADKLLLDPYARQIHEPSRAHPWLYGVNASGRRDRFDSATVAPKAVLRGPGDDFDWGDDAPPSRRMVDGVIYEMHVKGFTRRLESVPAPLRGTYAGLGHEAAVGYLRDLGVTAVQLLPVHHHLDDDFLLRRGLVNYWGYNTIGFFAPEARYAATDDPVTEFKAMVRSLHAAGIEVILDVVYNHTGEAGPAGPMIGFRGLDNLAYYRTRSKYPEEYQDFTGCGNSVNVPHPHALRLVLDSLRYWVEEMRVDGFRFDLAVTLAREPAAFTTEAAFFKAVAADPVLSRVKLIAEPWDIGRGGYQVGAFPTGWAELNGRYRDCVRRFWRGDGRVLGEFATRLTGSEDLFHHNGRSPGASVNFITSHDGFPLQDLVSWNEKHNEANGEENRDGDSHNLSYNHGEEGPTDDPEIQAIRERQCRNFLATLFLSQGCVFLLGGDEAGRTQGGNNNAYCQDNEISWHDWLRMESHAERREFVKRLAEFRSRHSVLRRHEFLTGQPIHGGKASDMAWFTPDAETIDQATWDADLPGVFSVVINRNAADHRYNGWRLQESDTLLLMFNPSPDDREFRPPGGEGIIWELAIDTALPGGFAEPGKVRCDRCSSLTVTSRSLQVWLLREGGFALSQEPTTE
ncbi:MAG: glycogen debranching protein GlgX [Verrucomicrobiales bacterium]|nr:glycogen debranching protein GlgX [Verrucomicrobiales bacterium]